MFKYLRTKLTVLYVSLFVATLGLISIAVYVATTRNVEHMVRDELAASDMVFDDLSAARYGRLQDEADVLARDFGFRAAVATHDRATVRSALGNLASRLGVRFAFVVTPDGLVTGQSEQLDSSLPSAVVRELQSDDAASGVIVLNGVAYEAVTSPVRTPLVAGWVVFGAPLGHDTLSDLGKLSAFPLQAIVLDKDADGDWKPLDSHVRLPAGGPLQDLINRSLAGQRAVPAKLADPRGDSIVLVRRLPALGAGQEVLLLLRCPLKAAFGPYNSLLLTIGAISLVGGLLLVVGSWLLARTLTRPISALEQAARQLQDGQAARVVVSTHDEIARLGRVFNDMAEDITEREASLKLARDSAEAANSAKSMFLANMNHEFRTPLNGILGVLGPLSQTGLDDGQQRMVGMIESSGAALQRLLNDVLDMVEMGSGQLSVSPQPFDLAPVLEMATRPFALEAEAKGLAFDVRRDTELDVRLLGDPRRLQQILANLLSNAVKFTPEGLVELSVAVGEDGAYRFAVRDTGVGFDPARAEQLFQPFSQADGSVTRSAGGAGLGLCLARQLARAMGGDVVGDAAPGAGALFVLTLPLEVLAKSHDEVAPASTAQDASARSDEADETALRVLLADDHPTNRAVVELILGALDVDMVGVENGAEALDAFKAQPFDVVLMDLQMPVMDGLTAIRRIREFEQSQGRPPTPIIVVSANVQGEHMSASAEAGADDHIAKPILAPVLIEALEKALSAPREPMSAEALALAGTVSA
jgi:signal transduction histidine kinase/AmiR/NasT family two-component response regulator